MRGQVKIKSLTRAPEDIFSCKAWQDSEGRQIVCEKHAGAAPNFIVTLKGINDRNAAESLKGTTLFAHADALPQQDQLRHALIGMETRLPNETPYGRVTGVYNFGAGDIVDIELVNGKTEMLPLDEKFVEIKDGYITVFPPDYTEAK